MVGCGVETPPGPGWDRPVLRDPADTAGPPGGPSIGGRVSREEDKRMRDEDERVMQEDLVAGRGRA